jgi:hypothetical protein
MSTKDRGFGSASNPIYEIYIDFKRRIAECRKMRGELESQMNSIYGFSGGIDEDEHVKERKYRDLNAAAERQYGIELGLNAAWTSIIASYGANAVNLAVESGEKRIGELPYVNEG